MLGVERKDGLMTRLGTLLRGLSKDPNLVALDKMERSRGLDLQLLEEVVAVTTTTFASRVFLDVAIVLCVIELQQSRSTLQRLEYKIWISKKETMIFVEILRNQESILIYAAVVSIWNKLKNNEMDRE